MSLVTRFSGCRSVVLVGCDHIIHLVDFVGAWRWPLTEIALLYAVTTTLHVVTVAH